MPPTGSDTGRRNIKITAQLEVWSSQNNLGVAFDSSSGFKLPNGADRSPDASWVKRERWDALTPEQQEICSPMSRFCRGVTLLVIPWRKCGRK
jgi:Uma2 family endonuclease